MSTLFPCLNCVSVYVLLYVDLPYGSGHLGHRQDYFKLHGAIYVCVCVCERERNNEWGQVSGMNTAFVAAE